MLVDLLREGIRRNKVSVGEPAEGSLSPIYSPRSASAAWINLKKQTNENFQRWISRFPYRGRTQRTAIRNVNCRTRESSDL